MKYIISLIIISLLFISGCSKSDPPTEEDKKILTSCMIIFGDSSKCLYFTIVIKKINIDKEIVK